MCRKSTYVFGSLLHSHPSGKGTRAQLMAALGGDNGTGEGAANVCDLDIIPLPLLLLLLLLLLLRGDKSSGMGKREED